MNDFDTRLTGVLAEGAADAVVQSLLDMPSDKPLQHDALALGNCGTCGSLIDFQPPVINAKVSPWHCQNCDSIFFAKADSTHEKNYIGVAPLPPFADLVAPPAPWIPEPEDATPPAHLLRLMKLLCNQDYRGVERRRYRRYTAVVSVMAVPLNDGFRVAGLPLRMTMTNVSYGGASLIHAGYHVSAYYALDFSVGGLALSQAVVQPVRMRALGPVYEIGGRFVRGLARKGE